MSLKELIKRDSKGLYKEALEGKRDNVLGINQKAEMPKEADLIINNEGSIRPEDALKMIIEKFDL